MRKILHISHSQDMDGKVPPMLTKLLNPDCEVEVLLLSNKDMNTGVINKLREIIKVMENDDDKVPYSEIIVTDLGLGEEAFDVVAEMVNFIPLGFYDHHIDSINNAKRYDSPSWAQIDSTVSATFIYGIDLAFQLKIMDSIHIDAFRYHEFIKNVSDYDTFAFKDNNNANAERLNILLDIAGDSRFEKCMANYLTSVAEVMGIDEDLAVVDYIIRDRQKFIDYAEKISKVVTINDRKCVIVFTDRFGYVSELGYQICDKHPEIDLLMAINPTNTNVQLRARKKETDLYNFAKSFGGGGHEFSAGFQFSMETYLPILKMWNETKNYLIER